MNKIQFKKASFAFANNNIKSNVPLFDRKTNKFFGTKRVEGVYFDNVLHGFYVINTNYKNCFYDLNNHYYESSYDYFKENSIVINKKYAVGKNKTTGDFEYFGIYFSFNGSTYEHTYIIGETKTTYYLSDKAKDYDITLFKTDDEAIRFYNKFNNKKYTYDWKETTKEKYIDMLECLPPEKRSFIEGKGEIFRMCEYTTGDITTHFKHKNNKYYIGSFSTYSYKDIKDLF